MVSMPYFEGTDAYADFLMHEAAHVFHNCKQATVGLNGSRRAAYLLFSDYVKQGTLAYACEANNRMLDGWKHRQRQAALERPAEAFLPSDGRMDHEEYPGILGEAVRARNGWQKILKRCSPLRAR